MIVANNATHLIISMPLYPSRAGLLSIRNRNSTELCNQLTTLTAKLDLFSSNYPGYQIRITYMWNWWCNWKGKIPGDYRRTSNAGFSVYSWRGYCVYCVGVVEFKRSTSVFGKTSFQHMFQFCGFAFLLARCFLGCRVTHCVSSWLGVAGRLVTGISP